MAGGQGLTNSISVVDHVVIRWNCADGFTYFNVFSLLAVMCFAFRDTLDVVAFCLVVFGFKVVANSLP